MKRARLMRTGQAEVCFQCEDVSIRKQGERLIPRKIISCHSEDEIRRISISWATGANPCAPSFRSGRQALCHCEPRSGVAIQYYNHLDCFIFLGLLTPHPSPLPKKRENPVTNLMPLSQCKTWRTLPC